MLPKLIMLLILLAVLMLLMDMYNTADEMNNHQ